MVRVGVLGAGGRMGQTVCRAVSEDPDLSLVAAVDPRLSTVDLRQVIGAGAEAVQVGAGVDLLERAGVEVAVDFTQAGAALSNMLWCAAHGVHGVVGTSGLSAGQIEQLSTAFDAADVNCVVAPNFAIGAVLMMRLCALAAPYMDGVEIVELHHGAKVDAPSGTALRTAELLEAAREAAGAGPWAGDPTTTTNLPGTRGGSGAGGVRIHSIRLPGLLAHQEVLFGAAGQSLIVRHDSYDRSSFMPGVVLAIKKVAELPGLTVGLEAVLGL
jgi:4-hydroxy-tetrahydrodipicolinate reductase